MVEIRFTLEGQPVPYLRMTQRQVRLIKANPRKLMSETLSIRDRIIRYLNWKEYVQIKALQMKIPKAPTKKIFCNVMIYFQNQKHGDIDNIYKGILDSLFENDKRVCGCMDYDYDPDNPRVEVEIKTEGR